jgi:hypothetical protein
MGHLLLEVADPYGTIRARGSARPGVNGETSPSVPFMRVTTTRGASFTDRNGRSIMSRRVLSTAAALVATTFLAACAAGPNELLGSASPEGAVAGFWLGLWHGFISFFAFIVSLFKETVGVYEVHNNGTWYNLGFILGVESSGTSYRW